MPTTELPSDERMLKLKKELNFLLWTKDPPPIPAGYVNIAQPPNAARNMQCVAHAVITGALFYQQGFRVVGRRGAAYVFDPHPGCTIDDNQPNQIIKHWWITANDELVDLSLYAESDNPLIFRNRSVGGRWEVNFKDITSDWQTHLASFQSTPVRRVFYVSSRKVPWSDTSVSHDTAQVFPAAGQQNVALTFGKIVDHCERLLSGSTASLMSMPQLDAWRSLA